MGVCDTSLEKGAFSNIPVDQHQQGLSAMASRCSCTFKIAAKSNLDFEEIYL